MHFSLRNGIGVRERPIGKITPFFMVLVLVDGVVFWSVLELLVLCVAEPCFYN